MKPVFNKKEDKKEISEKQDTSVALNTAPGILYLVATPIGNLQDISLRMVQVLKQVDSIACEDTRVAAKLLNHLELKKNLISYYEHNHAYRDPKLVALLLEGKCIALMSDAGTPLISDPGSTLVAQCHELGIQVVSIPGPCALICGLILSGLPVGRFVFEGFLPMNKRQRKQRLIELAQEHRTMVFYEAPHKLIRTLAAFKELFGGERRASLHKELTKRYESNRLSTLNELLSSVETVPPKGEYVLVIEGLKASAPDRVLQLTELDSSQGLSYAQESGLERVANQQIKEQMFSEIRQCLDSGSKLSHAVRQVALTYHCDRQELYRLYINMDNHLQQDVMSEQTPDDAVKK